MRTLHTLLVLCLLLSGLAIAQELPRAEVSIGYSYINADTNDLIDRQSLNGWESSVSVRLNRIFAIEGDVSGYYKNNFLGSGVNIRDYAVAGGPRINVKPVFVHALFGVDHLSGGMHGVSLSQNSFAGVFGGGVQQNVGDSHWALRTSFDYVLTRHNVFNIGCDLIGPCGPGATQHNFRIGVGFVYTMGRLKKAALVEPKTNFPRDRSKIVAAQLSGRQITLAMLGLVGEAKSIYGFTVTAVTPGSPAERANIVAGDYIVMVNGKHVKTAEDIVAALSDTNGSIAVTTSKPQWSSNQTERHELTLD